MVYIQRCRRALKGYLSEPGAANAPPHREERIEFLAPLAFSDTRDIKRGGTSECSEVVDVTNTSRIGVEGCWH